MIVQVLRSHAGSQMFSFMFVIEVFKLSGSGFWFSSLKLHIQLFRFLCLHVGFQVCTHSGVHQVSCRISDIYAGFEAVRVAWLMRSTCAGLGLCRFVFWKVEDYGATGTSVSMQLLLPLLPQLPQNSMQLFTSYHLCC